VLCYGLRTDFRTRFFPGSLRLMELADDISEIKTTCLYCTRKAVFSLKLQGGVPTVDGPKIDFGTEEKYVPACAKCYASKLEGARHGG
jgi:thymidine kinase